MVLWEITLATAYFLGLKRTFRLALKIQRRLISPEYPKIRQFAHGRTRAIFDMAVKVHQTIQERDIEVGRNLGNRILRWLDRMKPSANIRGAPLQLPGLNNLHSNTTKPAANYYQKRHGILQRFRTRKFEQGSSGRLLLSTARIRNAWRRSFPSIAMMMRPPNPIGNITQYRQLCFNQCKPLAQSYGGAFGGGIRKDIVLWMQQS